MAFMEQVNIDQSRYRTSFTNFDEDTKYCLVHPAMSELETCITVLFLDCIKRGQKQLFSFAITRYFGPTHPPPFIK